MQVAIPGTDQVNLLSGPADDANDKKGAIDPAVRQPTADPTSETLPSTADEDDDDEDGTLTHDT